jgi:uncharacterized DUF497 family protein
VQIVEFVWPDDRIQHLGRHNVKPEEFEEVCFGSPLVLRAKSEGRNPEYYALGETSVGRHLFCVVIAFPDGKGYPVTAREMSASERERYASWKKA